MNIEILHIQDCPSWQDAESHTREALAVLGRSDLAVNARLLRTPKEAAEASFAGSPTITFNGSDIFGSAGRTINLACRVYPTPQGLRGAPTTEQIVEALRARL